MTLKCDKLLFFILINLSLQNEKHDTINVIRSILSHNEMPSSVFAFVCWNRGYQVQLWKNISQNFISKISSEDNDILPSTPPGKQIFILDADCNNFSKETLSQAQYHNLFTSQYQWIIWGTKKYSLLEGVYIGVDSKVLILEYTNGTVHIDIVYKLEANHSNLQKNNLGTWRNDRDILHLNTFSVSRNRSQLMGLNIKTFFLISSSKTIKFLQDYRDSHIDSTTKMGWHLLSHLMDFVNATFIAVFHLANDQNDLNYLSLLKYLQTETSGLAGTPIDITMDLIDEVDFVSPGKPKNMKFILRAPRLSYVSNVYIMTFESQLWYCIFGLVLIIYIIIYLIVSWEWKDPSFPQQLLNRHDSLQPKFDEVLLMEIGAITQQGTEVQPKSNAGRIAVFCTFCSVLYIYVSYSAIIVALLQSTTESISNIEALLKSHISLGMEDNIYAREHYKSAQEFVRKAYKIAPHGESPNLVSVDKGIERVRTEFFAFYADVNLAYKMIGDTFKDEEKCGITELTYDKNVQSWLVMRKNSSYKEIFKVGMQRIYESGIRSREIQLIYHRKPKCHRNINNFDSISFLDCYAAFMILGAGIACGILLLLVEIVKNIK